MERQAIADYIPLPIHRSVSLEKIRVDRVLQDNDYAGDMVEADDREKLLRRPF